MWNKEYARIFQKKNTQQQNANDENGINKQVEAIENCGIYLYEVSLTAVCLVANNILIRC